MGTLTLLLLVFTNVLTVKSEDESCACSNTTVKSNLLKEEGLVIYHSGSQNIPMVPSNSSRLEVYHIKGLPPDLLQRLSFGPIPCDCDESRCGCCAGVNIQSFNFNQRGCMNFTYDPDDFAVKMDLSWNDQTVYSPVISGRNPPPFCIPMPIPYIPSIDFCVRMFNIHQPPGYNLFMCVDFEARVERAPILVLHFDCITMGLDGIHYEKPEDGEGIDVEDIDPGIQNEGEEPVDEVYDEVTEESATGNKTSTERTTPPQGLLPSTTNTV